MYIVHVFRITNQKTILTYFCYKLDTYNVVSIHWRVALKFVVKSFIVLSDLLVQG